MLARPRSLDIFSVALICVAVSFPIQVMVLYGHMPWEFSAIASKLTWLNWMVVCVACLNAYLVSKASPILKYTLPIAIGLVALNDWIVGSWGLDYTPAMAMMGTAGFAILHLPLCQYKVFDLFRHPEKRWWLRAPRRQVEVLAYVSPYNGVAFKTKTFDICEGGAFIPLYQIQLPVGDFEKRPSKKLDVNDRVALSLTLGNLAQIRCDAEVIRHTTETKGIYPAGIALSFKDLPRNQGQRLKRYIESLA